ncbi:hypothetical protein ACFJIW_00370 [Tahibacter sp. UC22_41]|uniref:hypothetical protein n=1 Tax=Tahibacter sp. UC22_41 TaxID=3350178 RepID=UPI0036DF80E5
MSTHAYRRLPVSLLLAGLCGFASAQAADHAPQPQGVSGGWTGDIAANLPLADRGGEETQAKILPRADGGFYVSWFDNTDGGYDLRLQRLDAEGHELWPHNGIVVADRTYNSTTDYGFSVDAAGNALLSFQCCTQQAADERIVVAKVDPAGNLLWSGGRVPVSTVGEGEQISYVTATGDGNAVVVWMNDSGLGRAQKLDPNGAPLWGATGITLPGPSGLKFVADVIAAGGNGDAIVSWSNQAGSTRILRAQKLAALDGAVLWGTDGVRIADTGNLSAGYFPKMRSDGAGGAVFAYSDFIGLVSYARVQHVAADGTRLLGASGTLLTTGTRSHLQTQAHYDAASGDVYAFWVDTTVITPNSYDGLYAQRVDTSGVRRWGEEGRELVPMTVSTDGTEALSQLVALPAPGGFLATWVTGNTSVSNNPIRTVRLDVDGQLQWARAARLKSRLTHTSRLTGATSTLGYAAFTWSDAPTNTSSELNVLGQNLQYNGMPGDTLFRDGFDE